MKYPERVYVYISKEKLNEFDNLIKIEKRTKSRSRLIRELIENYTKNTLKGENNNEK